MQNLYPIIPGDQLQTMKHGISATSLMNFTGICDHAKSIFDVENITLNYE